MQKQAITYSCDLCSLPLDDDDIETLKVSDSSDDFLVELCTDCKAALLTDARKPEEK